ncbi:hypothetical protein BJ973_003935 [Actinoplanes tereljensis]|uniref:SWIM-type domain-containing protein n=1 Tax=Paractinoplanes tereljensis TaxID=571912 RepID=A0A919TZ92_9ACTN|nr:hypothetical protein [Actinoplanes tereljensis]GIF25657.1 hypothetical protein Ate02nite_83870 [Actinoplanes tereljensis]
MRPDLLALTPETLAELTNRGLVKRATREADREPPALSEDPDGTVHATAPDGTTTSLPTGGLEAGKCSCAAPGVCRHVIALVLAYQQQHNAASATAAGQAERSEAAGTSRSLHPAGEAEAAGSPEDETEPEAGPHAVGGGAGEAAADPQRATSAGLESAPGPDANSTRSPEAGWSPGEFSDVQLAARIGERGVTAARRVERAGYVARVHRGRPGDPVPTVELPTATVRFLVPRDLGFARTDAVAGVRDDVIALAVWAFRAADEQAPGRPDVQVQVGGRATVSGGPGLDRAVALAGLVLREGAVHLGAGIGAEVASVRRELEAGRMRWPLLAVDDLIGQLDAYRDRSARYRPDALADHVAELFARHRAVTGSSGREPGGNDGSGRGGGASLVSRVLGTDEASETPLRRARLDGLGARVSVVGEERVVEVFLAHADSATVLVLRRAYETEDVGPRLGERRVAGVTIRALASGAVVTESASRSASRTVRLGARRLSRTEAMASRGSWQHLPRTLIASDLAVLAAELDALPPRPIRARVEAELVRVVPIAEVLSLSYAPGAQRLDAVVADAQGTTATITATHAACAPGRLDAVAEALSGEARYVAGSVRRGGGGVLIDPIGFAVGDGVLVPDLAPAGHGTGPPRPADAAADPLGHALDEALTLLAEVAHRGLLHTPPTMPGRLRAAADHLGRAGLRRAAESTKVLADRLGPDPGDEAANAWVDAYLRVSVTSELRP